MDLLSAISAFVYSVDTGSLASASRRLGVSPAAVSRSVAALEERLGTQLIHRTTRRLRLTEAGTTYLATCRRVLEELDAAERGVAASHSEISGLLTVTAPAVFGRRGVRPVIDAFLDTYPGVSTRLLLLERFVNLVDEGVDLAIRVGHLPDSNLIAIKLGEFRRIVCAAPSYLAKNGIPTVPADLTNHACISSNDAHGHVTWRFSVPGSRRERIQTVTVRPRLTINEARPAADSIMEGRGFARLISYQVVPELKDGSLQIVLADYEPPPLPVHLLFPRYRGDTAKLRAFIDFAVPRLKATLEEATAIVAASSVTRSG